MSLKEEERKALVALYWGKCEETLQDARCNREQKRWNATANRLYYALFIWFFTHLIVPLHDVWLVWP